MKTIATPNHGEFRQHSIDPKREELALLNARDALGNALFAVAYQRTEALNQLHQARDINNKALEYHCREKVDEAEQTYRKLLAMFVECDEPQAGTTDGGTL